MKSDKNSRLKWWHTNGAHVICYMQCAPNVMWYELLSVLFYHASGRHIQHTFNLCDTAKQTDSLSANGLKAWTNVTCHYDRTAKDRIRIKWNVVLTTLWWIAMMVTNACQFIYLQDAKLSRANVIWKCTSWSQNRNQMLSLDSVCSHIHFNLNESPNLS